MQYPQLGQDCIAVPSTRPGLIFDPSLSMAGLLPPDGPPLIPLPAPSAARTSSNTPILKWILSRPNTHLLPLHLLTTGGTLSALVDRKAFSSGDATAHRFKANAGNGTANGGKKKKRTDDVSDEKRAPTVSPFFSYLSQHSLLGQPADAMPLPQAWLKEERAPLSPLGLQLLQQPEAAAGVQPQLLLRPLQAARRDLAHDLRDRYDDADVVEYVEDEQQRQWRHFTPVLPASPATAAGAWLTGVVKEEGGVIRRGDVMHDDVIIGHDDDDRMTDDIDVVGYDEEEEEAQWRAYSPVLPPSPPLASSLLTGVVKGEVEQADEVVGKEKAMNQAARRPVRKRPSVEKPEVIYCKQYLGLAWLREQRRDRLVLTPQQRRLCSAIMARVSYLLPAEREMLAGAIGITQRQVHNVFTNRGGRATQRRAGGPSTEEAQRVIREELLNHGYAFNDVDVSVKE
ncbi:hypothetical protein PRIPAC_70373 [Pristionchus pacificus]|nr:hypothetical protein PRIPAC_70373 [Pristionchus pacificus]